MAVDVIEPVIVAVHVHGNDTVILIGPEHGSSAQPPRRAPLVPGEPITATVSFPCTCTATITGPITSTVTVVKTQ